MGRGNFFLQSEITLLATIGKIEEKRDDCNENHSICKQGFMCNHPTTSFAGEVTVHRFGVPQGRNAETSIANVWEKGYFNWVKKSRKNGILFDCPGWFCYNDKLKKCGDFYPFGGILL